MRAFPARRIRLVVAIPLILMAVINAGGAGAETLKITSVLSSEYVRLATNAGFQIIHVDVGPSKGSGAGQIHLLTDPGSPAIPFRVVRVLLPAGNSLCPGSNYAAGAGRFGGWRQDCRESSGWQKYDWCLSPA